MILALIMGSLLAGSPVAFKQDPTPEILISTDGNPDKGQLLRAAAPGPGNEHWLTVADYPLQARKERRTARIDVDLSIAADDGLTECRVAKDADQPDFATIVCPLIAKRGTFRHALAQDGSPVPAKLRASIYFYFRDPEPEGPPPVLYLQSLWAVAPKPLDPDVRVMSLGESFNPSIFVMISAEGVPTKCNIIETTGTDLDDVALCGRAMQLHFSPALDAAGRAVRSSANLAWVAKR